MKRTSKAKLWTFVLFTITGVLFIWACTTFLPPQWSLFLNDYHGNMETKFKYPFTINNGMWIVFFIGLAEAKIRYSEGRLERRHLSVDYVGTNGDQKLTVADLPQVMSRVEKFRESDGDGFLPRLLESILRSLKTSGSVGSALGILNTNVDLYFNVLESRYTWLDYVIWLVPTLGFIGTVVGVAFALEFAGQPGQLTNPDLLAGLAGNLGTAFYTTFIALVQAAILVGLKTFLSNRDEMLLNQSAQYCVERVLNEIDPAR